MKKKSVPIVFFGNERLATGVSTEVWTLKALINAGYDVKAVISNYNGLPSRNPRHLEIEAVTRKMSIPLLLPQKIADIKTKLIKFNAQVAVLVAYGQLIPDEIIDLFPYGIINIHPSLLPIYRGPTPIEQAILDGATKTGVSLMKLVKKMDSGPIIKQTQVKLAKNETKQSLADNLLKLGANLLIENLPYIIQDSIKPSLQDENKATYCAQLTKESGYINWNKTAMQLEREIRAFLNWPKSQTVLGGKNIIITEARVIDQQGQPGRVIIDTKHLVVCCGEKALEIVELTPNGKSTMKAEAFLAGYRDLLV